MPHRTPAAIAALLTFPLFAAATFADTYQLLASCDAGFTSVIDPQAHPILLNGNLLFTGVEGGANGAGTLGSYNLASGQISLLYNFTDGFNSLKYGGVTLASDGFLYGDSTSNTVYRIAPDGTGYQALHSLGSPAQGTLTRPVAVADNTIYSILTGGSSGSQLFSMNTDGSNLQNLHSFSINSTGWAGLTLSGSTIYGAYANDIFSLSTDGSSYTSLLGGSTPAISSFQSTLILSGNTLYGMGAARGANLGGGVFSLNTDGTGFTDLHDFNSGDSPADSLYLVGNTLYGMTMKGGANADGYVFSINTDGSNFQIIHTFSSGTGDGYWPRGSFVLDPSTNLLYGMTLRGGANDTGTIFSIAVPEPASLSLLTLVTPLLLRRRKSR